MYLAHIAKDGRKQSVREHCRKTAQYASESLSCIGLDNAAYLAGLVHDMGKCQQDFQDYIMYGNRNRGSVIHTFQGCRMLLEHFHTEGDPRYEDITSELLAYAVGAHHGLFDCIDLQKRSGFEHRMTSEKAAYSEVKASFMEECTSLVEIDKLFAEANKELYNCYEKIQKVSQNSKSDEKVIQALHFYLGATSRMLLSAVVEGDRRDTAEFMQKSSLSDIYPSSAVCWDACLSHMELKLKQFPNDTEIQQARKKISEQCRDAAKCSAGIYRLSVPTGSGKTLSSLRFALAHAKEHGKRRIIFTAPLLSIIDQNAKIIREYVGDDKIILEHHSNVITSEIVDDELDMRELLEENWNVPIIITSMVQLLNTFFSGKMSSIRRFWSLCGSIIVMDEVQTVPNHMLSLFNMMVNYLSEICDVTFVFCSATQPRFEHADWPINGTMKEMVPCQPEEWKVFKRTQIINMGSLRFEEIADFICKKFAEVENILVVCNKKSEAEQLFQMFQGSEIFCLHLSASMCLAHRRNVLRQAVEALKDSGAGKFKFLLVSTQVVEAGIDISFECVIRFMAGMDSVVQAAGRCNRNAERAYPAPVYVVNCVDESLSHLREIREGKIATMELFEKYKQQPSMFHFDLASETSISFYYDALYNNMPYGYQEFTVENGKDSILSMLCANDRLADEECNEANSYFLKQSFKTAGGKFQVFDDNTLDVVVPYEEGKDLILELTAFDDDIPMHNLERWIQKAKPYTVSLYRYQYERIGTENIIKKNGVFILTDGFYDSDVGFVTDKKMLDFLEV